VTAPATAVDVWWLDLNAAAALLPRCLARLSPDERARAGRLRAPDALAAFAITRAALRDVLGRRLGVAARALRFAEGPQGKPFLTEHPRLSFNVSHTQGRAAVAVSSCGPVGVDVERLDPRVDVDGLAERCFSPAEQAALRQVAGERRLRAFFDGWTRKEAFVKAVGTGLSHDLASFTVALTPGRPAELLCEHRDAWRLVSLDAGAQHAAALVVPRGSGALRVHSRCWRG
jgi:4'-phosphopantetheinyl transferase